MEERILSPIGLGARIVVAPAYGVIMQQVFGFEHQATEQSSFLNKFHWPIQIRPPPLFSERV
jgi:hypothetical protein